MTPRLILFTRFPTPGEAKTRLIPLLGAHGAAKLHQTLTERTVATLRTAGLPVEVYGTGAPVDAFREWLGEGLTFILQDEGGLGERLSAALDPAPCIFFGADTPDLSPQIVAQAAAALERHDGVIGPAKDGGYYLIGMKVPLPVLFRAMAWSTDAVFPETMRRVAGLGLHFAILETLSDCDRPEDLACWPFLTP